MKTDIMRAAGDPSLSHKLRTWREATPRRGV
jgi:hypothetical protein